MDLRLFYFRVIIICTTVMLMIMLVFWKITLLRKHAKLLEFGKASCPGNLYQHRNLNKKFN